MSNVFGKDWMSVFVDAIKHRLTPAAPGPDTIRIARSSFDDLVGIVNTVRALNVSSHAAESIHITQSEGSFVCALDNPYMKAEGTGRTLLEALVVAFHDFGAKTEERIR